MENLSDSQSFLQQRIRTLCDAEKIVSQALFQMQAIAWAEDLKTFFEEEYIEKKRQLERLEIIVAILKTEPAEEPDELVKILKKSMAGLANKSLGHTVTDQILIIGNQVIAKHLIQSYQTAICCAMLAGRQEATRILKRSLLAEKEIVKKLRTIEESASPVASVADIYE